MLRRSWIEISKRQIVDNYLLYKAQINTNQKVMAVVKADAYGHGSPIVAKILQENGVYDFAVSNINEAVELRNAGIRGQILILGYTPVESLDMVERYDITQALISEEYTDDIIASNHRIKCQYAIDTGMNRIGLNSDRVCDCSLAIRKAKTYLKLTGIFSHLCVADSLDSEADSRFTEKQIEKFRIVADSVKDLRLPYVHILNSAGGLWHNDSLSCFARLGIVLYGLKPDYVNLLPAGVRPVMNWKSVISMIKDVDVGENIGYGRNFTADRPMIIATIPTGYADGYNRMLSNKGYVLINGKRAPIVGRICMDQFMVDVTDITDVQRYDEVVLLGKSGEEELTADDMARIIGTIGYEIVCDIGKRVQRIYLE